MAVTGLAIGLISVMGGERQEREQQGNTLWKKTYGGSDYDNVWDLVLMPDGGALLGGTTRSKGAGDGDMYLVRVDSRGNRLWDKTYGGRKGDGIDSLVLTPDGGALLWGYTDSKDDMYLVRVDSRGNTLWEKTYGGRKGDGITSLVLTPDGGALLGGRTDPKGAGGGDMYLVRVDKANGEFK